MKSSILYSLATVLVALVAGCYAAPYPMAYESVHYGGSHGATYEMVQPGPAKVLTYPGKVSSPPCGKLFMLSCNQNVGRVPCVPVHSGHGGYSGGGYGGHSSGGYGGHSVGYAAPAPHGGVHGYGAPAGHY